MKRLFIIIFVCFAAFRIFAQSDLLIYEYQNISGKNYISNKIIEAKEYVFAGNIDQSYIDTTKNTLTLLISGTSLKGKWQNNFGNLLLFDLKTGKVIWDKSIQSEQNSFQLLGDVIIYINDFQCNILNSKNGDVQSEVNTAICYVDSIHKIGIGYDINFGSANTNNLKAIDLETGKMLWKRQITHEYGWNNTFHLNDSVLILESDGLHTINIKNGKGWDYKTATGKKDYTITIIRNILGITLGLFTGTFVTSSEYELITGITSNVKIDTSAIYFASRENISGLDTNGQIIWTTALEKNKISNSSIFIKDSLLYMINKGYAFMGNSQINIGKPYFSAYNKHSGKQVFYSPLSGSKNQIKEYDIRKDTVFLISEDRISKYSMTNGLNISYKMFETDTLGKFESFLGKQVFIKSDSLYFNLVSSDSTKHYLITDKNKVLVINNQLEILQQINIDQIYICYFTNKDYKFLAKGDETIVIDKNSKIVADFKASQNAKLIGTKLFDVQKKSVIEIDLSELLGK